MTFAPGDLVHVASLGKGVVREVRNGGRYLVELKGRAVLVDERQLSAIEGRNRRQKHSNVPPATPDREPARAEASLDLHGMTVPEATAALDAFVNDAILAGLAQVSIIHGRSGGRLKAAVHARLRAFAAVRRFRLDPRNPGVTIVEF